MDIFGAKTRQLKQKIELMEISVKQSFSKVRQDIDTANAWLSYYYQRSLYFESVLNKLNSKPIRSDKLNSRIEEANSTLQKHSKIINELADNMVKLVQQVSSLNTLSSKVINRDQLNFYIENISKELHAVEGKVESLSYLPAKIGALREELEIHITSRHVPTEVEKRLDDIQQKLKDIVVKKSPKEKLIQKVTKNSHDYIKAMILSYIKKYEKISAFQLREIVVEEQNITSKSTFYRIMEEIEALDEISTLWQGKEKIYLSKLRKTA